VDSGTRLTEAVNTPLPHHWSLCLLFGYASGMLGITGYETSCNYIEEQADGVYPKTLRNMWWIVTISNPLITLMCLGVMRMKTINEHKDDLLNGMGSNSLGLLLFEATETMGFRSAMVGWVTIDAFIVLFGAVLTSFVGAAGLLRRLSLDGCMPEFFLQTNQCRGTPHWIPVCFGGTCISIFLAADGNVTQLSGMYTIAFMLVMTSMAGCHIMLKRRAPELKRGTSVGIWRSMTAAAVTLVALGTNIYLHIDSTYTFLIFFSACFLLSIASVWRIRILLLMSRMHIFPTWCINQARAIGARHRMVYFAAGYETEKKLRAIITCFDRNELSRHVTFVHFHSPEGDDSSEALIKAVESIRSDFPDFTVDVLTVLMPEQAECDEVDKDQADDAGVQKGTLMEMQTLKNTSFKPTKFANGLTPKGIKWVCEELKLRTNDLVMGAPGKNTLRMQALLGIRIMAV